MPSRRIFKSRILAEAGVGVGASGSLTDQILDLSSGGTVVSSTIFPMVDPTGPTGAQATASDLRNYILGISGGIANIPEPTTFADSVIVNGDFTHNDITAYVSQGATNERRLYVGGGTGVYGTQVVVRAAAGYGAGFEFYTGTFEPPASTASRRWSVYKNGDAESGGNAGSGFRIRAYTDAGVTIDDPIAITRAAAGVVAISRPVTMASTLGVTGAVTGGTYNAQTISSAASFTGSVTLAGLLTVNAQGQHTIGAVAGTTTNVLFRAAAGQERALYFASGNSLRWILATTSTAESGSDAGSNFSLSARTDAGAAIDAPIVITRAAGGSMTLARPVSLSSTLTVTGVSRFNAAVAFGTTPSAAVGLWLDAAFTITGVTGYGALIAPTVQSTTTSYRAGEFAVKTQATAFVLTTATGIYIRTATIGAGSSITTQYGLLVEGITGATTNYAIYTSAGLHRFGDVVAVNAATPSTSTALITTAGTTGISSMRLPHGVAPTTPVDGDIWTTTLGLYAQINGSTVGPYGTGGGGGVSDGDKGDITVSGGGTVWSLDASQPNVTTMANLTTIGTLVAGSVPAPRVTTGAFGTGSYTFDSSVTFSGSAAAANLLVSAGTLSVYTHTGNPTVAIRMRNVNGTVDLRTWDFRPQTDGSLELRSSTDAGTTVATAFGFTHLTGALRLYAAVTMDTTLVVGGTLTHNSAVATLASSGTTSTVNIGSGTGTSTTLMDLRRAAGQEGSYQLSTGTSRRWRLIATATAESGSNVGTDLQFQRYDDAGVSLGGALILTRSTGAATFGGTLQATSYSAVGGAINDAVMLYTRGTLASAATSQYGQFVSVTTAIGATANINGIYISMVGNAGVHTTTNVVSLNVAAFTKGASQTVDNLHGVYLASTAVATTNGSRGLTIAGITGTGTTNYGVLVGDVTTGGTNYALYTGLGTVRIGDTITQNAVTANLVQSTTNAIINIGTGTGSSTTYLVMRSAAAQYTQLVIQSGVINRWALYKDTDAESGADAGSTLRLNAWTDAGVFIDNVLSITRAAGGTFTIARPLQVNSSVTLTGTLTSQGTSANLAQSTTAANVNIGTGTGSSSTGLSLRSAAGQVAGIVFYTGASTARWNFYKDGAAESGANAGSNLSLVAYDDAGASLGSVLSIARVAGGAIALSRIVTVSAGATTDAFTITSTGARQFRIAYDGSNYAVVSASSNGNMTWNAIGTSGNHDFSSNSVVRIRVRGDSAVTEIIGDTFRLRNSIGDAGAASIGIDSAEAVTVTGASAWTFSGFGVTVTSGGITVTGNSTITGTLGGITTLTTTADALLAQAASTSFARIGTGTGTGASGVIVRGVAGQVRGLYLQTGTSTRWILYAETTLETGSSAGSNLVLSAADDTGVALSPNVLTVVRAANGEITLGRRLVTLASVTGRAGLNVPHGVAPSAPVNGDVWTTTAAAFLQVNSVTQQLAMLTTRLDQFAAPTASVSFNDQEATSFRVENRTSDPGAPTVGQLWLRTDL